MTTLGFFTPVCFKDVSPTVSPTVSPIYSVLEAVDSYFYLGGRKAVVIPEHIQDNREGVLLDSSKKPQLLTTAFKIISYCTIILPLIMLTAKIMLRSTYKFHIIPERKSLNEMLYEDIKYLADQMIKKFKDEEGSPPEYTWL